MILKATPYSISHNAPVENTPDDPFGYLEIYLRTGLLGSLEITETEIPCPTTCDSCANEETVTVQLTGRGDFDSREEWYCPECGQIESDIPLRTATKIWFQPIHLLLSLTFSLLWVALIFSLGVLVVFAGVTNRLDNRFDWF